MKINLTIDTEEINASVEKAINNEIEKRVKAAVQETMNDVNIRNWLRQRIFETVRTLTNENLDDHVSTIIQQIFEHQLQAHFRYDRYSNTAKIIGSCEDWVKELFNNPDLTNYIDNIVANTAIDHPEMLNDLIDTTAYRVKNKIQEYVKARDALMKSRRFK